jgi:hypothetical protein
MENKMWRFGLTLAFVNLLGATALAEEPCNIFQDTNDEYALGRIPIGARVLDYTSNKMLRACIDHHVDKIPDKCYFDDGSILYTVTVVAGQPEAAKVLDAGITANFPKPARPLIAGLEWGDSLDVVYRKLNALPDYLPKWRLEERDGEFWFETGPCWRSNNGAVWGYTLEFWDGELYGVFTERLVF